MHAGPSRTLGKGAAGSHPIHTRHTRSSRVPLEAAQCTPARHARSSNVPLEATRYTPVMHVRSGVERVHGELVPVTHAILTLSLRSR